MQVTTRTANYLKYLALLLAACGCHAPACSAPMKPTKCVCPPHGPCAGYFATCWRQWPSECTSCPPIMEPSESPQMFAPPPAAPGAETVPPPAPLPGEMPSAPPGPPSIGPPQTQQTPRSAAKFTTTVRSGIRQAPTQPSAVEPSPPGRQLTIRAPRSDSRVVVRPIRLELHQPPPSATPPQSASTQPETTQPMLLSYPSSK
jgi:hypothetical protein